MSIFKKKLKDFDPKVLPIEPIELYQSMFHNPGYEYLRGIQEEVLKTWHEIRFQKDIICKMNTGSGKTLTGLLMLYSKMIEGVGNSVYVCPDNQLLEQVVRMAKDYGIPICTFEENNTSFPSGFINCTHILICNFHKLFNGKSVFNRDKIKIGSILLDDAHHCVDIARENTTIKLPRKNQLTERLLNLFKDSLQFQAKGTFFRMNDGDPHVYMKVPYWTWMDNMEKITELINSFKNEDEIKFKWDIIADDLLSYDCYFSGVQMEISPNHVPYNYSQSFDEAKHRFILSATFEDDIDLIKDLGISKDSILNPITPKDRKDIGQRLILAPSRFDSKISDKILQKIIVEYSKKYNVVILVSSGEDAKEWVSLGATKVDKTNINKAIEILKKTSGNLMVFVNRYDGVDLYGNLCRILVLDGTPVYGSLHENYIEERLESVNNARRAQIIEQGLGRAVRSGSDYCVALVMGGNLVSFLGYNEHLKYFTPITKAQINLGLKLLDEEETGDASIDLIKDTIHACLEQEEEWRTYHSLQLSKISSESISDLKIRKITIAEIEQNALKYFRQRQYKKASEEIEKIINDSEITEKERAWYYQLAAQFVYPGDKLVSNDLQIKAATLTTRMFHPQNGFNFSKISKPAKQQALLIKQKIAEFTRSQDIVIYTEQILNLLQYNPDISFTDFENKLAELGSFLGFSTQQPERDTSNGPDVLWCMTDGHYLILEAKSRATHNLISRDNIEQLLHSETWFLNTYGNSIPYSVITLQGPSKKENNASVKSYFRVIDKDSLNILRENLRSFSKSFENKETNLISEEEILEKISLYKLTPNDFKSYYLKEIK